MIIATVPSAHTSHGLAPRRNGASPMMAMPTMPTAEIAAPTMGIATAAQTRPGCSRPWSPLRPIMATSSAKRANMKSICHG